MACLFRLLLTEGEQHRGQRHDHPEHIRITELQLPADRLQVKLQRGGRHVRASKTPWEVYPAPRCTMGGVPSPALHYERCSQLRTAPW
eukprot:g22275.t1